MKNTFLIQSGCLAICLSLFMAGASYGQSGKIPFLIDIPNAEAPSHLLSGDKYLTLAADPAAQQEKTGRVVSTDPAPMGLYLSKKKEAKGSQWAFKPAEEENLNGEYFLECLDGTERLIAWNEVEGLFFRPLSRMDGKMREMATWHVALGGVDDVGETHYTIHPTQAPGKMLANDRKTGDVGVFDNPTSGSGVAERKRTRKAETKKSSLVVVAAPDLEILWKRVIVK